MLEYSDIVKLIASLSIVVIFIYAIYYLLNKFAGGSIVQKKGAIKIEELRYIAKGKGLCLVKVKDELFLLSFDESGIKKLKEWNEER